MIEFQPITYFMIITLFHKVKTPISLNIRSLI